MTQVKNFQDISYDELMDIDGGGFYVEGDSNGVGVGYDGGNWGVEAGYDRDRGLYVDAWYCY